jgi:plasmid maintenance system antidote protein VapI
MTPTPMPSIALREEQLEKFRHLAGLTTAKALADKMGLHDTTVRRTLGGQTGLTSDFIARLLAAFPSLKFDDLFEVKASAA